MQVHPLATVGLALTLALGLSGCGADDATTDGASSSSSTSAAEGTRTEAALAIEDGWVKATDTRMTGVFGTLRNTSDEPVTIVAGTSDVAGLVETHVTLKENGAMVMRKDPKGFTLEPGTELRLEPGGNHIMLMKLEQEIKAGDEVTVRMADTAGATHPLTVQAREFTGANEEYAPGEEGTSMSSMSHS